MPCPFFEPQKPVSTANGSGGRLPLIEEYDGLCRAGADAVTAPESARFRWCNHGNSKGCCPAFPDYEKRSCLRYEVIERADCVLRVLCIEEQSYAPLRWYAIRYISSDGRLEPEPADFCVRSQILAFCRSYLLRFPIIETQSR